MKNKLCIKLLCFGVFALMLLASPSRAQVTAGFHRFAQAIVRSPQNTTALIAPYATVTVSNTGSGLAATIYSDPAMGFPITGGILQADQNGNYGYYMAFGICVTEAVSYPSFGATTTTNICSTNTSNPPGGLSGQFEINLGSAFGGVGGTSNTVMGYLATNTPAALPMPACNGVTNAITWAPGVGFGCNLINVSGGGNATELQGIPISTTSPVQSAVPVYDISSSQYDIRPLTQDDIAAGFTIISFTCGLCTTVEIGATVNNPAFTASYSSTPSSASITNTLGINSPFSLTTPFTSGTVIGVFTQSIQATTTFTLTAIGTSTKTATKTINWYPRSFGGVGAAGATSSVTASGTTAVLSNGAVLASAGLSASNVGQVFGPYTASGQKIYILCIGGSHTFKDSVTGFAFAFNTPTLISFVNVNGATVTMYLYESTNLLTGSYSILVVS